MRWLILCLLGPSNLRASAGFFIVTKFRRALTVIIRLFFAPLLYKIARGHDTMRPIEQRDTIHSSLVKCIWGVVYTRGKEVYK